MRQNWKKSQIAWVPEQTTGHQAVKMVGRAPLNPNRGTPGQSLHEGQQNLLDGGHDPDLPFVKAANRQGPNRGEKTAAN